MDVCWEFYQVDQISVAVADFCWEFWWRVGFLESFLPSVDFSTFLLISVKISVDRFLLRFLSRAFSLIDILWWPSGSEFIFCWQLLVLYSYFKLLFANGSKYLVNGSKTLCKCISKILLEFSQLHSLPIFNENCNSQIERAVAVPAAGWTRGEASKKMQLFFLC